MSLMTMTKQSNSHAPFSLEDVSIADLQTAMEAGTMTALDLTETYLDRIIEFNKRGPCVNAVIEVNPDAWRIAQALDRERALNGGRGPLHGIPVLLKDNIATRDKMNTSSGSYLLQGIVVKEDATVVKRLREAGAIILGKANMDELGLGNGIPSGRGGPVRNPYDLDRDASGSSSGSAAAVAANFTAAALGTDARSSIRFPAADCSVVALKPTVGLISRAGILLGAVTIDTVGPLTRTVADLAIMLGALTGLDPLDAVTNESAGKSHNDYTGFLNRGGLYKARIGVAREGFCGITEEIDSAFDAAIAAMKDQGAEVVDPVVLEPVPYGGTEQDRLVIEAVDQKARLEYFEGLAPDSPIRSFEQFCFLALTGWLPTLFDSRRVLKAALTSDVIDLMRDPRDLLEAYWPARNRFFAAQREVILSVMDRERLDALVFPTKSKLATPLSPVESLPQGGRGMPELASYSGFPELTVPAGYSRSGLPIGLSFLGRAFSEPTLLGLAYAYEQTTRHRRPPRLPDVLPRVGDALPQSPSNDRFADRLTIRGASGTIEGNNFSADVERGEPRHGTSRYIDRSVWYSWTAPQTGPAEFDTSDSYPAWHCISVYTGTRLTGLSEVACNNYDGDEGLINSVEFQAEEGVTYQIAIGSNSQTVCLGNIVLKWSLDGSTN